jgi:hypothetical protein
MSGVKLPCVTDLAETAAVYAVMHRHYSEALRIVNGMTSAERARYGDNLRSLLSVIGTADRAAGGTVL